MKEVKRIGIITLQWANNYGGLLQCYALSQYLSNRGYDVEVLNYWPIYSLRKRAQIIGAKQVYKDFGVKVSVKITSKLKNKLCGDKKASKVRSIDEFRNFFIPISEKPIVDIDTLEKRIQKMDVLIVGSDQVWNPSITGGQFDKAYFLDFFTSNAIRIAYAASTGISIPQEKVNTFIGLVSRFDKISARESSLAELLSNHFDRDVCCVLDPVFLLDISDWKKVMSKESTHEEYILVYTLESNPILVSVANELSRKTKLKVVVIGKKEKYENVLQYVPDLSVQEFLSYIYNAQYIITNSFHGTAFSIIFHKRFFTIPHTKKPSRMVDLLHDLGLISRVCNDTIPDRMLDDIDYMHVEEKMRKLKESSAEYLNMAIKPKDAEEVMIRDGKCSGCSACEKCCPVNAIALKQDDRGFYKAVMDYEKCIKCGLCNKVCPHALLEDVELYAPQDIYAAKNADDNLRAISSSGGIYLLLAEYVLALNGVVYGVANEGKSAARHVRAITIEGAKKCCKSKYIQSEVADVLENVYNDLSCGRKVLFTGTPCQIVGLLQYLSNRKQSIEELITVDIVCHGTPSPGVFSKFINYMEQLKGKKIKQYYFRNKDAGWRGYNCLIEYEDGTKQLNDFYGRGWKKIFTLSINDVCFGCRYAQNRRVSDITMADFWGIENTKFAKFEDKLGVSMLLVNTDKGKIIIEQLGNKLHLLEATIEDCKANKPFFKPTAMPTRYNQFWNSYLNDDVNYVIEKYCRFCGIEGVKEKVKWMIMYKLGFKDVVLKVKSRMVRK